MERADAEARKEKIANSTTSNGQAITCQAAVLWKPGEKYKLERIIVAAPRKDQVRVKILYASICQSDLSIGKMPVLAPLCPFILGHEGVGIVESVGENVTHVQAGDTVLPFPMAQCGTCRYCQSGTTNRCEDMPLERIAPALFGSEEPHFRTEEGNSVIKAFCGLSTFSEYIVMHKKNVAKIQSDAPLEKACLISCGICTGMGSVWNTAKLLPGASVAVFGLGTVGLAALQACKIAGASRIIGVDIDPSKFTIARDFGATDLINPKDSGDKSLPELILALTGGLGVEYSFECAGKASLMNDAVECTRKDLGTAVMVGADFTPGAKLVTDASFLAFGRRVLGAAMGGTRLQDLPDLVDRAMSGEIRIDPFITHRFPFSKINDAVETFASGKSLRCVLHMGE